MEDYIDYSGESTDMKPNTWSAKAFKKYFADTFWKVHKAGGAIPWTMKEQVFLKTFMDEYDYDDLADMIVYWHMNTHRPTVACKFANFYCNRVDIYHKMKEADSDYSWD